MIRLMFVATYSPHPRSANVTRAQDSVLTLMFDDFLYPKFDQTLIFYGPGEFDFDLIALYKKHGVNTDNIFLIPDSVLFQNIDQKLINFRPSIRQQLIKLLALDQTDSNLVMIQDCDIFAIKPYHWLHNDKVVLFAIENTCPPYPEWHEYVEKFLGLEPFDNHCYMNEFLPIYSNDWQNLKFKIEQTYQMPWLEAIHWQFCNDLKNGKCLEFSEYELLSHWMLHTDRATSVFQSNIRVPAPLTTRHGKSSREWFFEHAKRYKPNCVQNANQCSENDLFEVSVIIRDWIAAKDYMQT